jgi:hypothetical protein
MRSNSALPAGRLPLALASLVLVAAASAHGADVSYYLVSKAMGFNQNTSAGPVPKGNPARFFTQVALSQTNSATNATVQFLPSGSVIPLTLSVGGKAGVLDTFSFQAKFASQSALDAAYPNGNYQMIIHAVHDGTKSSTLALNGNGYPASEPFITNPFDTNFSAVVVTNPAAPFTLTWAPLTGGTSNDFLQVTLANGSTIIQTPAPGQPGALNGTATSLVLPANALPSGLGSLGSLVFAKVVQLNSTAYPGVPGFAAYYAQTDFGVVALAEDVAGYNISKRQFFNQNSSGAPVLAPGSPFRFIAQISATASNSVNTAQVQPPAPGGLDPLTPDPTDTFFAYQQSFPTQAALDAAFVSGAYTVQITAVHDGNRLATLTLPSDSFPIAPHFTDWAPAQNINPAAGFNLTWDTFSGATALDDIVLTVSDSVGNSLAFAVLLNTATSYDFPAGTFQGGQTYQVQVQFRHLVSQDTTSYPGVTGSVRFVSRTQANLTTAGGSVAPVLAVVSTNGAGPFQLQLTGQSGRLYAIDASTNLQIGSWMPLVTNTAVGGQFTFTDTQASNFPNRFYRGRAAN